MRGAVAVQTPAFDAPSTACILAVCTAEILGLAGYSIVPALLPQIMAAWSLDSTQGGWLAGINAGGYMVGVTYLARAFYQIGDRDIYWSTSDIGWIVGHSYIVYAPLLAGCATIAYEGSLENRKRALRQSKRFLQQFM